MEELRSWEKEREKEGLRALLLLNSRFGCLVQVDYIAFSSSVIHLTLFHASWADFDCIRPRRQGLCWIMGASPAMSYHFSLVVNGKLARTKVEEKLKSVMTDLPVEEDMKSI